MQKKNTYTIRFEGEVRSGHEVEKVKEGLARLFKVRKDEVNSLFQGEAIFERSGLNKFTAQQYYNKLSKIGLLCYLERDTLPIQPSAESATYADTQKTSQIISRKTDNDHSHGNKQLEGAPTLCPKCKSENITAEECSDCGIIFDKFKKRESDLSDNSLFSNTHDQESTDYWQYRQKAIVIFKHVSLYFLVIFTLDSFTLNHQKALQYVLSINITNPFFDIGYNAYILGHIGLVWGCYYIAKTKGRSGIWAGLGGGSLLGLGILLLLPGRDGKIFDVKVRIFALFIICFSIFWSFNFVNKLSAKNNYLEQSIVLREQRHEYPTSVLDADQSLFEHEFDELHNFLDQGFGLLSKYDYRPIDVCAISEAMFSETARLFVWLNYQHYMQFKNGANGLEYLSLKNIFQLKKDVCKKIKAEVNTADIFAQSLKYQHWFIGYDDKRHHPLGHNFHNVYAEMIAGYYENRYLNENKISGPEFTFENYDLSHFSRVKVSTQKDLLFFDFSQFDFQANDKTLVVAFYYQPRMEFSLKYHKKVTEYSPVQLVISPDFPSKHLLGSLSLFNEAAVDNMLPQ